MRAFKLLVVISLMPLVLPAAELRQVIEGYVQAHQKEILSDLMADRISF